MLWVSKANLSHVKPSVGHSWGTQESVFNLSQGLPVTQGWEQLSRAVGKGSSSPGGLPELVTEQAYKQFIQHSLRISLVQLDTWNLILAKQQSVAKAFLGFADGKSLRPGANQICKLSESCIPSDTQNVSSLLPLIVITSGNFPSGCHGAPARSRKNMEGGILVLLQMTAQGQQQATAEGS